MKNLIRQIKYWWNCKTSGLQKLSEDLRDLDFKDLVGTEEFKPTWKEKRVYPVFQKNQQGHRDCSFQAGSNTCAVYFGENISAHWLRLVAYWNGWCNLWGEAELRSIVKVAQKYGVLLESEFSSDETMDDEILNKLSYSQYLSKASERKIGSYWRLRDVSDVLRAIDLGYGVIIGRKWLTSMNAGGGFSAPWIIRRIGLSVGGHALMVQGANMLKDTTGTDIELNSYGKEWGDGGYLYCPLKDLQQDIDLYGAYCITPVPYTPKEILIKTWTEQLLVLRDLIKNMKIDTLWVDLVKSKEGTDFTNDKQVSDEVSCAFALSTLLHEYDSRIPIITGTALLADYLANSPYFKEVKQPITTMEAGWICISATGTGNGSISGHAGVYVNATDIMSNSSLSPTKGLWVKNYTRQTWRDRYFKKGGMSTHIYELVV